MGWGKRLLLAREYEIPDFRRPVKRSLQRPEQTVRVPGS